MKYLRKNIKPLLIVFILLLGLVVGVYLVKNPKIFRSRANSQPANSLQVTDYNGENIERLNDQEAVEFGGNDNVPVFRIKDKGSTFKIHYSR